MHSLDWQYAPLTTNFGSSRSEPPWPLSSLQKYNPSKFCWFAVMKLPSLHRVHLTGVHLAGVHRVHLAGVHLAGVHLAGLHLLAMHLLAMHLLAVYLASVHLSVFLASVHRAHLGRGMRAGGGWGCFHPPPHVVERRGHVRGLMVWGTRGVWGEREEVSGEGVDWRRRKGRLES